ncbi:mannose-1-phosphate guanylyltransferase [Pedosphaera parvula]|uniref:mannose-1-phosphate guanylyltransferase n=1 Tax=Pedosphaera parvula (strain Ellin514) TaxID=320771 RepID=B9XIV7_PEDPL|nr:sugar phosphate nucleotidyltransferase [Pedosphaera parvula]EEF60184.1 Mannose-1-phosphate guanylyltransferase (GDP) [Pedosphaera parvula Ellin514]
MRGKTDTNNRYVIIMAGGKGERFWPVSRQKTPKQLITLLGKRSFLQQAVDRVLPLVPLKNIIIITNEVQAPTVRKQLPKLPKENIIAEPCGRDTCAAVTLGAAIVGARSTTAVMAVLPADHVIPEEKKFQQVLSDAFNLAARGQVIVTIGIKPTEAATGYGYIHTGAALPTPEGAKPSKTTFYKAERFVEKPDYDRAVEYLNSGQYRWNAGMFIWSFVTVTEGLQKHQPEMYEACQRWFKVANNPAKLKRVLEKEYPNIKKISIDFALMEHAQNVVVADGSFEWDDLGSWTALARHLKPDAEGNCAVGDFIHVDAARNIIFDARTKNRTPIAVVGLRDSILVQTDDAILLAHKSQAQKIKELVVKLTNDKAYKKLV